MIGTIPECKLNEVSVLRIQQNRHQEQQGPHELLGSSIPEWVVGQQVHDAREPLSEDGIPRERKMSCEGKSNIDRKQNTSALSSAFCRAALDPAT